MRAVKRVVIIETQLRHYRRRFLLELAAMLRARGVELVVAYSDPSPRDRARADTVELPGIGVKVPAVTVWHDRVVLQRAWRLAREADLVIVGQANGLVLNYALLALSRLGVQRVAYWGHGYNHQARRFGPSERLKRRLVRSADWWFAYTPGVAQYLEDHGVEPGTITTVHNTTDTDQLADDLATADRAAIRRHLGLGTHASIGLYCGALVTDKRLGFLVDAAAALRDRVPGFELVIVGDGPERAMLEAIARYRPYLHVVGSAFDRARSDYFAVAEIALLPAQVGLAVVDAFAAGLPVATTTYPGHGPELEYLDARTGLVTEPEVERYTAAVAALLVDRPRHAAMRAAARARALELPLHRMVTQFADGITRCLELA